MEMIIKNVSSMKSTRLTTYFAMFIDNFLPLGLHGLSRELIFYPGKDTGAIAAPVLAAKSAGAHVALLM